MISTTDLIPLREPTFYILLTLSQEKKHGYAILRQVEVLSGGSVSLSTGTLYGALSRLLTQGLIQRVPKEAPDASEDDAGPIDENEDFSSSRQRRTYQLTQFGRRVLENEIARMQALLSTAQRQMGKEPV